MKKNLIIILVTLLIVGFVGGIGVLAYKNAKKNKPTSETKIEEIVYDEEKVNIYLFWGDGCPHCEKLTEFLNNIEKEYKVLYNLYKFEVWYNDENSELMDKVAEELGKEPNGVPFLVIGEKSFIGYNESLNEDIKKTIKEQSQNNFDVFRNLNK